MERVMTASELATCLRVRRAAVDSILATGGFAHAETPEGGSRRATYWQVSADGANVSRRVQDGGTLSQTARLLHVLADGAWHASATLYQYATVLPARIRELRRRGVRVGYTIEARRAGRGYQYRLVPTLGEFHLRSVAAGDVVEVYRNGKWTTLAHGDSDLQVIEYGDTDPRVLRRLPSGTLVQPPWRVTRPGYFRLSEPLDVGEERL